MTNIFESIDSKNKYKLLHSFRADIFTFDTNESILNIVNDNNNLCLITKGSVSIISNSITGNDYVVEKIYDNNLIGSNLYNLSDLDINIVTNEKTEIISMNYSDVLNYNGKNKFYNIFIKNLFKILANKEKENNERINILTKKTIRNKLLRYFEIMYKKNNSRNIYLPFTYTELADYLAVDRSAMTREIKYLKEEGFIVTTGKRITLLYK